MASTLSVCAIQSAAVSYECCACSSQGTDLPTHVHTSSTTIVRTDASSRDELLLVCYCCRHKLRDRDTNCRCKAIRPWNGGAIRQFDASRRGMKVLKFSIQTKAHTVVARGEKSLFSDPRSELHLRSGGRKRKRSAVILDETREMSTQVNSIKHEGKEKGASQHTRLLAAKRENMKNEENGKAISYTVELRQSKTALFDCFFFSTGFLSSFLSSVESIL